VHLWAGDEHINIAEQTAHDRLADSSHALTPAQVECLSRFIAINILAEHQGTTAASTYVESSPYIRRELKEALAEEIAQVDATKLPQKPQTSDRGVSSDHAGLFPPAAAKSDKSIGNAIPPRNVHSSTAQSTDANGAALVVNHPQISSVPRTRMLNPTLQNCIKLLQESCFWHHMCCFMLDHDVLSIILI